MSSPPTWTLSVAERPSADWDSFLALRPKAAVYLQSGWTELARDVFGHRALFIEGRAASGALAGVLPVVQQKSLLLGNFATSVPFFNYGGAEADSEQLAQLLMERARDVARDWGCSRIEFRDAQPRPGEWQVRRDKVTMILQLPPTFAELSKQLGSKLRSQVKRAERENALVRVGGAELTDSFYEVFAENMRDLGTPVYPRAFFHEIVRRFPSLCRLLVIESNGRVVAGAFLIVADRRAEIPWASCKAAAKPLGFNMRLYWEVLRCVTDMGCTEFDFGRSTVDAGTYRFKQQWGAQPVQLYWHRWERRPSVDDGRETHERGDALELAARIWQKLPLPIANTIGPWLSPKLPW